MRKIAVEIEVIDDRHCSKKCEYFNYEATNHAEVCSIYYEFLERDKKGYLRTAECRNSK